MGELARRADQIRVRRVERRPAMRRFAVGAKHAVVECRRMIDHADEGETPLRLPNTGAPLMPPNQVSTGPLLSTI